MEAVVRYLLQNPAALRLRRNGALMDDDDAQPTNADMVNQMVSEKLIVSDKVKKAFEKIDRKVFVPESEILSCYSLMPLRDGLIHISAPTMYAEVLENLGPFEKGMTFLNIGSGTGYLNSLMVEILDPEREGLCVNHGIDIWSSTIGYAEEKVSKLGLKDHIQFFKSNIFQLDTKRSAKYDRIYLGACAPSTLKRTLYDLLEIGGVLVGPFALKKGHQMLRKVTRVSKREFRTEDIKSVQFAALVEGRRRSAGEIVTGISVVAEQTNDVQGLQVNVNGHQLVDAQNQNNNHAPVSINIEPIVETCIDSESVSSGNERNDDDGGDDLENANDDVDQDQDDQSAIASKQAASFSTKMGVDEASGNATSSNPKSKAERKAKIKAERKARGDAKRKHDKREPKMNGIKAIWERHERRNKMKNQKLPEKNQKDEKGKKSVAVGVSCPAANANEAAVNASNPYFSSASVVNGSESEGFVLESDAVHMDIDVTDCSSSCSSVISFRFPDDATDTDVEMGAAVVERVVTKDSTSEEFVPGEKLKVSLPRSPIRLHTGRDSCNNPSIQSRFSAGHVVSRIFPSILSDCYRVQQTESDDKSGSVSARSSAGENAPVDILDINLEAALFRSSTDGSGFCNELVVSSNTSNGISTGGGLGMEPLGCPPPAESLIPRLDPPGSRIMPDLSMSSPGLSPGEQTHSYSPIPMSDSPIVPEGIPMVADALIADTTLPVTVDAIAAPTDAIPRVPGGVPFLECGCPVAPRLRSAAAPVEEIPGLDLMDLDSPLEMPPATPAGDAMPALGASSINSSNAISCGAPQLGPPTMNSLVEGLSSMSTAPSMRATNWEFTSISVPVEVTSAHVSLDTTGGVPSGATPSDVRMAPVAGNITAVPLTTTTTISGPLSGRRARSASACSDGIQPRKRRIDPKSISATSSTTAANSGSASSNAGVVSDRSSSDQDRRANIATAETVDVRMQASNSATSSNTDTTNVGSTTNATENQPAMSSRSRQGASRLTNVLDRSRSRLASMQTAGRMPAGSSHYLERLAQQRIRRREEIIARRQSQQQSQQNQQNNENSEENSSEAEQQRLLAANGLRPRPRINNEPTARRRIIENNADANGNRNVLVGHSGNPVNFANASSPNSDDLTARATSIAKRKSRARVNVLPEVQWCKKRHKFFPQPTKDAIHTILMATQREECNCPLPTEIWVDHIFPNVNRHWFDPPEPIPQKKRKVSSKDGKAKKPETRLGVMFKAIDSHATGGVVEGAETRMGTSSSSTDLRADGDTDTVITDIAINSAVITDTVIGKGTGDDGNANPAGSNSASSMSSSTESERDTDFCRNVLFAKMNEMIEGTGSPPIEPRSRSAGSRSPKTIVPGSSVGPVSPRSPGTLNKTTTQTLRSRSRKKHKKNSPLSGANNSTGLTVGSASSAAAISKLASPRTGSIRELATTAATSLGGPSAAAASSSFAAAASCSTTALPATSTQPTIPTAAALANLPVTPAISDTYPSDVFFETYVSTGSRHPLGEEYEDPDEASLEGEREQHLPIDIIQFIAAAAAHAGLADEEIPNIFINPNNAAAMAANDANAETINLSGGTQITIGPNGVSNIAGTTPAAIATTAGNAVNTDGTGTETGNAAPASGNTGFIRANSFSTNITDTSAGGRFVSGFARLAAGLVAPTFSTGAAIGVTTGGIPGGASNANALTPGGTAFAQGESGDSSAQSTPALRPMLSSSSISSIQTGGSFAARPTGSLVQNTGDVDSVGGPPSKETIMSNLDFGISNLDPANMEGLTPGAASSSSMPRVASSMITPGTTPSNGITPSATSSDAARRTVFTPGAASNSNITPSSSAISSSSSRYTRYPNVTCINRSGLTTQGTQNRGAREGGTRTNHAEGGSSSSRPRGTVSMFDRVSPEQALINNYFMGAENEPGEVDAADVG